MLRVSSCHEHRNAAIVVLTEVRSNGRLRYSLEYITICFPERWLLWGGASSPVGPGEWIDMILFAALPEKLWSYQQVLDSPHVNHKRFMQGIMGEFAYGIKDIACQSLRGRLRYGN